MSSSDQESIYSSEEEELREAFLAGKLKPGLNIETGVKSAPIYKPNQLVSSYEKLKLDLPWLERLDLISDLAPMAPEMSKQFEDQKTRRTKQIQGNKKLPQIAPEDDPVLNDFQRETLFHRQAQSAVLEALPRLKKMKLSTIRPDDYFAEMAKTDDHMQKIRQNLTKKQAEMERCEKVRQARKQKKLGREMKIAAEVKKQEEKRKMNEDVKKYRKGVIKNLDFLEEKKKANKARKDRKFGFGGKKRGSKVNDRNSSADFEENKKFEKERFGKDKKGKKAVQNKRPGKTTRQKQKMKRKNK